MNDIEWAALLATICALPTNELREIIKTSATEIHRRGVSNGSMQFLLPKDAPAHPPAARVSMEWHGYNDRRYSKPWIALVTAWPVGGNPELTFGGYTGDDSGGELEISAHPGDVLKFGQKDYRNPRHTRSDFGVVEADLTVREITPAEARKLFKAEGERDV